MRRPPPVSVLGVARLIGAVGVRAQVAPVVARLAEAVVVVVVLVVGGARMAVVVVRRGPRVRRPELEAALLAEGGAEADGLVGRDGQGRVRVVDETQVLAVAAHGRDHACGGGRGG